MRVLIVTSAFDQYSGTPIVTRDLALGLQRAGHQPLIFAPLIGEIAAEVRAHGIEVLDNLAALGRAPDIIHGHHHQPLMEALLRFPLAPAVFVCHDATNPAAEPPAFPRIQRYVAVDERCRARIEQALGGAAGTVTLILNAVDMARFQQRAPLPQRPRRALLFSNYAEADTQLPAVKKACRKAGLQLDVAGEGVGAVSTHPEDLLPQYDLVFAKARCALEAMAVGNAVILCDFAGVGPYVTSSEVSSMRPKNFGRALLTEPLGPEPLLRQIARYDPVDAAAVSNFIRRDASLDDAIRQWLDLYRGVLDDFDSANIDREAEGRAAADYLRRWHYFQRRDWEHTQLRRLQRIPLVGGTLYTWVSRLLRRWALSKT